VSLFKEICIVETYDYFLYHNQSISKEMSKKLR
jgi:hypothetical protein